MNNLTHRIEHKSSIKVRTALYMGPPRDRETPAASVKDDWFVDPEGWSILDMPISVQPAPAIASSSIRIALALLIALILAFQFNLQVFGLLLVSEPPADGG